RERACRDRAERENEHDAEATPHRSDRSTELAAGCAAEIVRDRLEVPALVRRRGGVAELVRAEHDVIVAGRKAHHATMHEDRDAAAQTTCELPTHARAGHDAEMPRRMSGLIVVADVLVTTNDLDALDVRRGREERL